MASKMFACGCPLLQLSRLFRHGDVRFKLQRSHSEKGKSDCDAEERWEKASSIGNGISSAFIHGLTSLLQLQISSEGCEECSAKPRQESRKPEPRSDNP